MMLLPPALGLAASNSLLWTLFCGVCSLLLALWRWPRRYRAPGVNVEDVAYQEAWQSACGANGRGASKTPVTIPQSQSPSKKLWATSREGSQPQGSGELVHQLDAIASDSDYPKLVLLLGALVEDCFKGPSEVEHLCDLGIAQPFGRVVRSLTHRLEEVYGGSVGRQPASCQPAAATPLPSELAELGGGEADTSTTDRALGAACLQASWLLVQLAGGSLHAKRAVCSGVTPGNIAAFMSAAACEDLVLPASAPASSCGSLPGSSGSAGPCSNGTDSQHSRASPAGPCPQQPPQLPHPAPQLGPPLPHATRDAVLRNCSRALFLLCDAAAAPSIALGTTATQGMAEEGPPFLAEVALAVEVGQALLPPPRQLGSGSAEEHCAGIGRAHDSHSAPADVLVRMVQCWDGLEAAVTAGGVLACLALLGEADAGLAARARGQLLAAPTVGHLAELLCHVGPLEGDQPADRTQSPADADDAAAAVPPAPAASRPLSRPCAVVCQFLSQALSDAVAARLLLRRAVSEHAVSWLLHAAALPLALRRQVLRQLLGPEGRGALAAECAQLVDVPLALCHVISAPPRCHSLLPPGVAGELLSARWASDPLQLPYHPPLPPTAASGPLQAAQQEDDDLEFLDAAEWPQGEGQQAGAAPEFGGGHAAGAHVGEAAVAAHVAAQLPMPVQNLDELSLPTSAETQQPVTTLAAACRLLLASGRLDSAFRAFFVDLRAAGSAIARSRRLAAGRLGASADGEGRLGGDPQGPAEVHTLAAAMKLAASCSSSSWGGGSVTAWAGMEDSVGSLTAGAHRGEEAGVYGSGGGSGLADLLEGAAQAPLGAGIAATGVTSEGVVLGYRRSASGSTGSTAAADWNAGSSSNGGSVGAYSRASTSAPPPPSAVCQAGPGAGLLLTDVMAAVAGLMDAMMWRSASLTGVRGLRGGGVDHEDSMSESVTVAEGLAVESSRSCGGAAAGAAAVQSAPGGVVAAAAAAGQVHSGGAESAASEPPVWPAPMGLHAGTAGLGALRLAAAAADPAALGDHPTRHRRRYRRSVVDVRSVCPSDSDGTQGFSLGVGEEEEGEPPHACSAKSTKAATTHGAEDEEVVVSGGEGVGQQGRRRAVNIAAQHPPSPGCAEDGSTEKGSVAALEHCALAAWVHERSASEPIAHRQGEAGGADMLLGWAGREQAAGGGCSAECMLLMSSVSDDMSPCGAAEPAEGEGLAGGYDRMGSSMDPVASAAVTAATAAGDGCRFQAIADNVFGAANGASGASGTVVGDERSLRTSAVASWLASHADAAAPAPLPWSLVREGTSTTSSLPPYTYFGSAQLTAAALAVPVDVAAMAASLLPSSGRGSNSAASQIAIAAAAAAAAATAATCAAGDAGGGATTAATTLAASKAAAGKVAGGGGGGHMGTEGGTGGAARWPPAGSSGGLALFGACEVLSDTHLASDVGTGSTTTAAWVPESSGPNLPSSSAAAVAAGAGWQAAARGPSPFATAAVLPHAAAAPAAAAAGPGDVAGGAAGGQQQPSQGSAAVPLLLPSWASTCASTPAVAAARTPAPAAAPASGLLEAALGSGRSLESPGVVFEFGSLQVEVSARAFRALRRSSPLLYGWLSRLQDRSRPITILQVPGLDDLANRRVFLQLLGWAQGVREVGQLLQPPCPQQQQQQPAAGGPVEAAGGPSDCCCGGEGEAGCEGPLEQLRQLWQAADYLQVDELLTAVEDELAARFTQHPAAAGRAAWVAALSLAASHCHAASRLAGLCALHFMRRCWCLLGDEEALLAAAGGAAVLGPAVAAEVRDRLVALVALADQDSLGGGLGGA
ncbi:hypothetical protein Agub_g6073 [Astrephomene gubernaculifera]|uniref:Uncharacterized protein n=1 Tax=Astrephomene gubernaculifera TaxID=47775 RepID=A0AAD3DMR6_9CHLO|nr:hypothetical protein Agub_g6073 [Astrephomene gubernaculifera]